MWKMRKKSSLNKTSSLNRTSKTFLFSSNKNKNSNIVIVVIFLSTFATYILIHQQLRSIQRTKKLENDIQYFEFTNPTKKFNHLDPINPSSDVRPKGFLPIDRIHREGKIHQGSWMFVIDTEISKMGRTNGENINPKILLLKRSKELVTCPNTWSLVGEHTFRDEEPIETARRGIMEELGSKAIDYITNHGRISNLTEYPFYYERDYGISNEGRVDRQITYMWLVEMNYTAVTKFTSDRDIDDILKLDDEVVGHKWIHLETLKRMLQSNEVPFPFCHDTIVSLSRAGLKRLLSLSQHR